KRHGGTYPGPLPFIETMRGIKLDAVRGPVSLDDRLTAVNNIYIKKVEKKKMFGYDKDELWNTVIKTYPNVSQFWTYDKDTFLKQPLYSRDFPPCKYCEQKAPDGSSSSGQAHGGHHSTAIFTCSPTCSRSPTPSPFMMRKRSVGRSATAIWLASRSIVS